MFIDIQFFDSILSMSGIKYNVASQGLGGRGGPFWEGGPGGFLPGGCVRLVSVPVELRLTVRLWILIKGYQLTSLTTSPVVITIRLMGSALQARYSGPYRIERRVGDLNYVLSTPDRRRKTNRLKSYRGREESSAAPELESPRCADDGGGTVALSTPRGAEVVAFLIPVGRWGSRSVRGSY